MTKGAANGLTKGYFLCENREKGSIRSYVLRSMDEEKPSYHPRGRNAKKLWALVLLGIVLSSLLHYRVTLTGADNLDGILSVVIGLYTCSHPAANMVDLLFFRRGGGFRFPSSRSAVLWLMLNLLVLLVGWMVIFLGTTRLICRSY